MGLWEAIQTKGANLERVLDIQTTFQEKDEPYLL